MRKIITFLGVYPKLTEYSYQDQIYEGKVFAEAMYQFVDFDEMLVFVTKKARQNVFSVLEKFNDPRIKPVQIPNGEDQTELWQIFEALTNAVDEHDVLIFDITHGLRSNPFLIFLAVAFLKSAKQVKVEAIYYGAFELQQKKGKDIIGPAPVIDLSEFVTLLDWMNVTDQFIRSGNARPLAEELRAAKPHYQLQRQDKTIKAQSIAISKAATALEEVSQALRLILPDRAMQASEDLQSTIGVAAEAINKWARPFSILAQQISNTYAPLALDNPREKHNLIASFNRERQLVSWYLKRNQVTQAVATAREWLVTWGLIQAGYDDPYHDDTRQEIEKIFGHSNKQRQENSGQFDDYTFQSGIQLQSISNIKKVLNLYNNLGEVRNTLLHAGKQSSQKPANDLEKQVIKLCEELDTIPLLLEE